MDTSKNTSRTGQEKMHQPAEEDQIVDLTVMDDEMIDEPSKERPVYPPATEDQVFKQPRAGHQVIDQRTVAKRVEVPGKMQRGLSHRQEFSDRYCPQCGQLVQPNASFCSHCGAPLVSLKSREPVPANMAAPSAIETPAKRPKKGHKKRWKLVWIGLVVIVALWLVLGRYSQTLTKLAMDFTGSIQRTAHVTSTPKPTPLPATPTVTVRGFGSGVGPTLAAFIADNGSFGDVCRGDFKDLNLTINNAGGCTLIVSAISSTSAPFLVPLVLTYPIVIQPGDSVAVPIRFQPTSLGPKAGIIRITSNDPLSPKLVAVSGNVPPGNVRVVGSTDFGDVCPGTQAEKTISVCNVGQCNLTVTNVSFLAPCPDFIIVNNPFPAVLSPNFCLGLVLRFTPTSCGTKSCLLEIVTDDPATPVIMLVVTANAPCAAIDVPPDLGFPPEVIQNAGPCSTAEPFPISNTGGCNLVITNIWLSGTNAGDYSLLGLPSFPIILEPGHIVGEGNFNIVFAPTVMARERQATLNVTYISDPFTGATTTISRQLCGEGVLTGARVLVMHAGVPLDFVERIHLQRVVGNRNKPLLDTTDIAQNLPLVTVIPDPPCEPFQYHREYGTVSNPIQLLPGVYQVTASATINGKRKSLSVGFNVDTCDFNPTVVINFP